MPRATLELTRACNNRCIFCAQDGLPAASPGGPDAPAPAPAPVPASAPDAPDDRERALEALRRDADEVTFVGGEPTLEPRLPELVAAARRLGFRRVGLQTNGRRLAQIPYAEALAAAGLTDVHVSVHGAEAAVHDYHTSEPGSFKQLFAGVAAVRALGLDVVATTVLTRSNYRVLDDLPRLLASRGVAAWLVAVPRVAGRAAAAFDRVVPRLGLAAPFALRALEAARKHGLVVLAQGIPACLMGPMASLALPEPPRAHGEACAACEARPGCSGLDAVYLERFAGDELRARPAPTAAAAATAAARAGELARMFVGPGPLAPPERVDIPAPPQRHRLALPVLGKSQPARAEVSPRAPRRTGEALKELFPALFDRAKG